MRIRSVAGLCVVLCAMGSMGGCRRIVAGAGAATGSASRAVASRTPEAPTTAATTVPENTFASQFERQQQVLGTFQHTDAVRSCWQSALMRDPAHTPEAVHVQLAVDAAGHAQIVVSGATDTSLANCIRLRAAGRSYGVGGEVATEAVFNLAPGG